ncbi:hypothetical protein [Nitratifractor sp.]
MKEWKNRIVVLCTRIERLESLGEVASDLAESLGCGVSFLYVREEGLLELPIFSDTDGSDEAIRRAISEGLGDRANGWAVFVHDADPADRILLEAEREKARLILTDRNDGVERIVRHSPAPIFVAADRSAHPLREVLIVLDPAFTLPAATGAIDTAATIAASDAQLRCFMDYELILDRADPSIDPVVGAMTPEILAQEEADLIERTRERFESLCRERGQAAEFNIGEGGMVDEILQRSRGSGADLLILVPQDRETLLADAAPDIVREASADVLILYGNWWE